MVFILIIFYANIIKGDGKTTPLIIKITTKLADVKSVGHPNTLIPAQLSKNMSSSSHLS